MGILIIHTPSQLEQASSLVDLLEASLELPEGAILCSSLPGYAWPATLPSKPSQPAEFTAALDSVRAAIALLDGSAVRDPQLCFDLAAAWARGKRIALLADHTERRSELPAQLSEATLIERMDRAGLVGMVEDLAFDLGVRPRIGQEAQRALEQLSSAPPPPNPEDTALDATEGINGTEVPLRAAPGSIPAASAIPVESFPEDELDEDEEFELGDDDVEPLREAIEPLHEMPRETPAALAQPQVATSCELAFEAGRAVSECSFHRDEGGDFAGELEGVFGRFVDSVGGSWEELRSLGDVELWLGATDNLLDALPEPEKQVSEWYEAGFQFSTLRSIAEQGFPEDPEQRSVYQELWDQSMAAFRNATDAANVPAREARRVQALLENLIGPESQRDYSNLARSLSELRSLAQEADRL